MARAPRPSPVARPAQDALDIERRSRKDVRLRNEAHRYVLCCERIQGIVKELADKGVLQVATRFAASRFVESGQPAAIAYIAVAEVLSRSLRGSPYPRVSATFFPPDDAQTHMKVLEAILSHSQIEQIFTRASREASLGHTLTVSFDECRNASATRLNLLRTAAAGSYGVVDVVELV